MVAWASTAVTNSCTWHPLLVSCVAQYQLAFIHPLADGNGRLGRLWQTLILSRWNPLHAWQNVTSSPRAGTWQVL